MRWRCLPVASPVWPTIRKIPEDIMDIHYILEKLPHRYPFLLVDRILDADLENKSLRALKNVTINEPFFTGHFPSRPVMPGVLMVEALAQASALLGFHGRRHLAGRRHAFLLRRR